MSREHARPQPPAGSRRYGEEGQGQRSQPRCRSGSPATGPRPNWTPRTTPSPSQLPPGPRGRTVAKSAAFGPSDRAACAHLRALRWLQGGLSFATALPPARPGGGGVRAHKKPRRRTRARPPGSAGRPRFHFFLSGAANGIKLTVFIGLRGRRPSFRYY
jgi:hypothetical protein